MYLHVIRIISISGNLLGQKTKTSLPLSSMFFLEFGLDFEQNFQSCFLPMLQSLDLNTKDAVVRFQQYVEDTWKSMKNWNVKTSLSKKSIFKKLFQNMASLFQVNVKVITIFTMEDDSEVEKLMTSQRNFAPIGSNSGHTAKKPISIVHVFDEKLERNGFLLPKISPG